MLSAHTYNLRLLPLVQHSPHFTTYLFLTTTQIRCTCQPSYFSNVMRNIIRLYSARLSIFSTASRINWRKDVKKLVFLKISQYDFQSRFLTSMYCCYQAWITSSGMRHHNFLWAEFSSIWMKSFIVKVSTII